MKKDEIVFHGFANVLLQVLVLKDEYQPWLVLNSKLFPSRIWPTTVF
jgi:hypothetical protein